MKPLSAFRTQIMAQYLHGSGKFQILVQSVLLARKGSLLVYLRKQVSDSYRQALWSIHAAPTYLILCSRLHFTTILAREEIIEIYIMFISVSVLGPTGEKHPVSYFQISGFSLERRQKRLLSKEENASIVITLVLQM